MLRFCCLAAAMVLTAAAPASAQTAAYDNTGQFQGFNLISNFAATKGSNTVTGILVDDITFAPGSAGLTVTAVTVAAANQNATAVTVRPFLRFWLADGTNGGPGTYFSPGGTPLDVNFGPITLGTSTNLLRIELGANSFQIPAAGKLWVGLGFDDANGTTGATFNQMHNLGYNLYNPPAVGSSADTMFITGGGGETLLGFNNPPGNTVGPGGNPVYNAGYKFEVNPVPEPVGGLTAGLAAAAGYAIRRRRPIRRTPA
jgi:hypothetical protein